MYVVYLLLILTSDPSHVAGSGQMTFTALADENICKASAIAVNHQASGHIAFCIRAGIPKE